MCTPFLYRMNNFALLQTRFCIDCRNLKQLQKRTHSSWQEGSVYPRLKSSVCKAEISCSLIVASFHIRRLQLLPLFLLVYHEQNSCTIRFPMRSASQNRKNQHKPCIKHTQYLVLQKHWYKKGIERDYHTHKKYR